MESYFHVRDAEGGADRSCSSELNELGCDGDVHAVEIAARSVVEVRFDTMRRPFFPRRNGRCCGGNNEIEIRWNRYLADLCCQIQYNRASSEVGTLVAHGMTLTKTPRGTTLRHEP